MIITNVIASVLISFTTNSTDNHPLGGGMTRPDFGNHPDLLMRFKADYPSEPIDCQFCHMTCFRVVTNTWRVKRATGGYYPEGMPELKVVKYNDLEVSRELIESTTNHVKGDVGFFGGMNFFYYHRMFPRGSKEPTNSSIGEATGPDARMTNFVGLWVESSKTTNGVRALGYYQQPEENPKFKPAPITNDGGVK